MTKSISFIFALVFSFSLFAKVPATQAVTALIPAGVYEGKNGSAKCLVTVTTADNAVSVTIQDKNKQQDNFTLVNSSANYSVNESTGELSATQKLNFPHYVQGGSKILNIRGNDIEQVEVFITTILLDHRGNDASTYAACNITL